MMGVGAAALRAESRQSKQDRYPLQEGHVGQAGPGAPTGCNTPHPAGKAGQAWQAAVDWRKKLQESILTEFAQEEFAQDATFKDSCRRRNSESIPNDAFDSGLPLCI